MDDTLRQAYLETDYHVFDDPPVVLRIGQTEPAGVTLLSRHGVAAGAFLTAWNPFSRPTSDAENAAAQARLLCDIEAAGFAWLQGAGKGRDPAWPAEESFLILGISRGAAEALSRKHGQNAFVWIAGAAAPELVLTG